MRHEVLRSDSYSQWRVVEFIPDFLLRRKYLENYGRKYMQTNVSETGSRWIACFLLMDQ
jgi:hypothetical protein